MRASKKPVEVEVILFNKSKWEKEPSLYPMVEVNNPISSPMVRDLPAIKTLEGMMTVRDGDYIIEGVQGEYYPCKPDIFEKTYEILN